MLDEERAAGNYATTVATAAVQATSRTFLQDYTAACLTEMDLDPDSRARQANMVAEMIALLDKTP